MSIHVTDVNDARAFGTDVPRGAVRVSVTDWTYNGRDNTEAMRKAALRHVGGTRARIARRWSDPTRNEPCVSFLVLDPTRWSPTEPLPDWHPDVRVAVGKCGTCGVDLVERTDPTPEAAASGTWFDHPGDVRTLFGHTVSLVIPRELVAGAA